MSPFQIFAPELRRLGFRKAWSSRAGGGRVDEWSRTDPDAATLGYRQLSVQLWEDGHHRISHAINNRATTEPTGFDTIEALHVALERETTRMDNLSVVAALNKAMVTQ